MKKSHEKGRAGHLGPESCADIREDGREVLTGESAGEPLSREIATPEMPTPLWCAEGNTPQRAKASAKGIRRGRRPSACMDSSWAGTERSRNPSEADGPLERGAKVKDQTASMHGSGKSDEAIVAGKQANKPNAAQADLWAGGAESVERRASTKRNASQQSISRTQSRAHGMSQELERVRQRARKESSLANRALRRQALKVRARCGNSARRDLCGGRGETRVPTATHRAVTSTPMKDDMRQRKLLGYRGRSIAACALPSERFNTRARLHPVLSPSTSRNSFCSPNQNPTANRVRNATFFGYVPSLILHSPIPRQRLRSQGYADAANRPVWEHEPCKLLPTGAPHERHLPGGSRHD